MSDSYTSRQIRSLVTDDNNLRISIETADVPQPGPDEVVVRVEAAPINPSDLALLFGPADMMSAKISEVDGEPLVEAPISPKLAGMVAGRQGESMLVGNEAAGVVVAAGESDAAQALLGKTVAIAGGDMFQQYRCIHTMMAIPMGEDVSPREAASSFVNPMTALGMVETMREEGFTALVHTAAASNLGQMLNRICIADGVDLVNIVRKPEQAEILREIGAKYIVDSSAEDFEDQLTAAITATNAYMAFDATGGGKLANTILTCMERAASAGLEYNRYGSDTMKKVYIYGRLDLTPLTLTPAYGFSFNVGGFLLTPFLQRIGIERMVGLQQRVAREIKTTFASHYVAEISLSEALSAEAMMAYGQRQTGQKYLICPHK